MTTHYTLFDINTTNTKIWSKRLGKKYPLDVICDAVNNITADVYVSPANGACQLDGGIDKVYRAMFPEFNPSSIKHSPFIREEVHYSGSVPV